MIVLTERYGTGGITKTFALVRTIPNIRELPEEYRNVVEWARIAYVGLNILVYTALTEFHIASRRLCSKTS